MFLNLCCRNPGCLTSRDNNIEESNEITYRNTINHSKIGIINILILFNTIKKTLKIILKIEKNNQIWSSGNIKGNDIDEFNPNIIRNDFINLYDLYQQIVDFFETNKKFIFLDIDYNNINYLLKLNNNILTNKYSILVFEFINNKSNEVIKINLQNINNS